MKLKHTLFIVALIAANAKGDEIDDQASRIRIALALAAAASQSIKTEEPHVVADPKSAAISAWLAQPLNHGNCPCAATGQGCHCQPHSDCARGNCAAHNPLLSGNPYTAPPIIYNQQSCPNGQCPSASSNQSRWYPGKLLFGR